MSGVTLTGLGSNVPVDEIVQKLVAVERRPIETLNAVSSKIKTKLSAFGKIQSALSSLRDAAAKLGQPSTWQAVLASTSDATIVGATGGAGASAGRYAMDVTRLASHQSLSSPMFKADERLGAGTLTLELGTWSDDRASFTAKAGSSAKTIEIDPPRDSLADVRDKINQADAGVMASLVTDFYGTRLVVRSKASGAEDGFRITGASSDGGGAGGHSLADLSFNGVGGSSRMNEDLQAVNAQFKVNGLDVTSATNNVSTVVEGLTLNLVKAGSATVQVSHDKDSMKKAVTDFIAAYNSAIALVRDNIKYDADTKTAGTLQGDSTAVGIQNRLRSTLGSNAPRGGAFGHLSDVGMSTGVNGAITLNEGRLTKALAQPDDLKQLFQGTGSDSDGGEGEGIATRLRTVLDQLLSMDGAIATRTEGLQASISNNNKRMASMEDRVAGYEKRLKERYTALDKSMATYAAKMGMG